MSDTFDRIASRLKIRHLSLLLAIQRHGSLSRVADELGVSQPAATKALAEVEAIFGAKLFTRSRHGMQPTELGGLALTRARHMLEDVRKWADEADALRDGRGTHLSVGAVPFVSGDLLTQAIQALHDRHGVSVTLHRAGTDQLMEILARRELDCVIGRASVVGLGQGVQYEMLYPQVPVMVAHPALASRINRSQPDWGELADMKWILPSRATPTGIMVSELFVRAQVQPPQPIVETYSMEVLEGMLGDSDNILSIVPEEIALQLCAKGRVAIVPWTFDRELPAISLIRQAREVPSQPEEQFATILRELCVTLNLHRDGRDAS